MSNKKLLPCPFCGGEAFIYYSGSQFQFGEVVCKECESHSDRKRVDEAVEVWNTRVPMQKIVERLEEQVNSWEKVYNVIKNRGYIDDYTVGAYDGYRNSVTIVKKEGGLNG